MRVLLLAVLIALSATAALAQSIPLVPAGGPPGGSADAVLALDGGTVLLVQDGRPFRSTDAGETWTRLRAACLDGSNWRFLQGGDGAVYAAMSYPEHTCRSTDGGATWTDVTGTDLRSAFAVRTPHGWFVAGRDSNVVLRSTDDGRTWQRAGTEMPRSQWGPTPQVSLHVFPTGEVVAVGVTYGTLVNSTAIYRWRPDSLQWSFRAGFQASVFAGLGIDAAGRAVMASRADPYAMYDGDGVLVSSDAGETWTNVMYTPKAPPCAPNVVRTGADGVVRTGGDCGVHRWNADGTWTEEGAVDARVTDLATTSDGTVYAASGTRDYTYGPWGTGLYRRASGAQDWRRLAPSEATSFVSALSADGRLAATPVSLWRGDGAAWMSVAGDTLIPSPYRYLGENPVGLAWAPWGRALVHTRMPQIATGASRADTEVRASGETASGSEAATFVTLGDSTVFAIGTYWGIGLHRSRDRGRTFEPVDSLKGAYALVRRADGRLFAAGSTGRQARLWTSVDGGETWTRLPTPAPASYLESVAVRDGTPTVYVRFGARLFRSDDNGQTWRETGTAQGRLVVHAPSGSLFEATPYYGIRHSRDSGATWDVVVDAQAPPRHPGMSLAWTTFGWTWPIAFDAAGHLVTASPAGGLLRSAWPVDAESVEMPAAAGLRVWPSPARGPVRIDAGTLDPVEATVHDVLGRVVARLLGPGDGLAWDASAAPVGVYMVRVIGEGGRAATARVVVAR